MSGDNRLHTSAAITFLYVRLRSFLFLCVFLYLYGQAAEKEAAGTLVEADAGEEATAAAKVHSGGKNRHLQRGNREGPLPYRNVAGIPGPPRVTPGPPLPGVSGQQPPGLAPELNSSALAISNPVSRAEDMLIAALQPELAEVCVA